MSAYRERKPAGLVEFVATMCDIRPDAPAIIDTNGSIASYAALCSLLAELVLTLREAGLSPGDRVISVLPEGPQTAQLLLALAGAVTCCPVDPLLSEDEYARRIALVRPAAMVIKSGSSWRARDAAAAAGLAVIEVSDGAAAPRVTAATGTVAAPVGTEALPPGLLLATSGTTGTAKLAVIPWPVMYAGALASVRAYGLTARDRRLNIMPQFHIQGLVGSVLASLACGGSVTCAPAFTPAEVTRSWLDGVTWFSASPAMHQQILDAADPRWRPGDALRFVRSGSAGLPVQLRERLEAFYRVPVVESYGMTEAHQIASSPLPPHTAVGLVATGSEVAIEVGPGQVTTEPGRRGQILVRGDNVVSRYIPDDPTAFGGGWFRTGDQGELAADGSIRLTGRLRELIIRGGENITPLEVEEVLRAYPGVRDACVAGIPDPVLGERVAAAVVMTGSDPAGTAALRSFAARRLAPFKVPEIILSYRELPVTGSGKVARAEIARQLAEASLAGNGSAGNGTAQAQAGALPGGTPGAVLALWRQALGDDTVGPADDFYAAGGDSLAVTTMLAAVAERFGVEISPLEMFDAAPTAEAMASYIQARAAVSGPR